MPTILDLHVQKPFESHSIEEDPWVLHPQAENLKLLYEILKIAFDPVCWNVIWFQHHPTIALPGVYKTVY